MFDSLPLPLQAIVWPLIGAAIILITSRFLPGWLCRLAAAAAALASLAALWSMRTGAAEAVEIFWEPLNFFRMGPLLRPDGLSLLVGITLSGGIAAAVLGIRGATSQKTGWYGLILIALAGCLLVATAANLPTLALGSALIDLALIATAATTADSAGRTTWRMAVPGIASTLMLVVSAVQMSSLVGSTSLLASNLPVPVLSLMGAAGLLRLMVFPLHPRGLNTPENAATLILLSGIGIYVLARVQAIAPVFADQSWMLALGSAALLAGGLLSWTGGTWFDIAVHQTGLAFMFVIFYGGAIPWPLLGLTLALGMLAIWWDSGLEKGTAPRPRWFEWGMQQLGPWWSQARPHLALPAPVLEWWSGSWWSRQGTIFFPAIALAALAGMPLTAGALGRWPLYAMLLKEGNAPVLIAALVADTLLVAGLWTAFRVAWRQRGERRLHLTALLALLGLVLLLIAAGIAPGYLTDALGLEPTKATGVSAWGLGLIYALPWLLGSWLARAGSRLEPYFEYVRRIVYLDWLFRAADWIGQRLLGGIYWLGQVGEGEGWWGWALIILALGAIFLTTR